MNDAVAASIAEQMSQLPKHHQQALNAFDWQRKCQKIGEQHSLLATEITGLQAEVALVLMGLSEFQTLHTYIDEEIGGTGWQDIEQAVVEHVLQPINDIMEIIVEHDG